MKNRDMSRRVFTCGGAAAIACTAGLGTMNALADETANGWEPAAWDYETDFVIVGYGAAGACAAITVKSEELGDAIVLEVAPPEYEGGNTRVSGNIIFNVDTVEGAFDYQKELNGEYAVDDEMLQAWAEALGENVPWLESLGADMQVIPRAAEFATAPAADQVKIYCVDGQYGNGSLWKFLKSIESQWGYQVINNARVTSLVRNPSTNEACGAIAELEDGSEIAVKARKAVILACGGYENNPEIVRNNYQSGTPRNGYFGTPYNRGDGFKLVGPFGAALWHMNSYSGGHLGARLYEEGFTNKIAPSGKGWIYVGADNTRFMYEETSGIQRHGKIKFHGVYMNYPMPDPVHLIMGAAAFEEASPFISLDTLYWPSQNGMVPEEGLTAEALLETGMVAKADTIEELAEQIGRDPNALAATVAQYNEYCAQGVDPDFHRGEPYYEYGHTGIGGGDEGAELATEEVEVIRAFDLVPLEGPFYAIEMRATYINTQGGPKRNKFCQIVDCNDNPIPRLYGTGEFGSIYGYEYNGGGNIAEAIASGRVAARHAATLDAWDA